MCMTQCSARSAHSCVTVIGHHEQQDTLRDSQGKDKVELKHAATIRDGLLWKVHQQLRGGAEIQEAEV